MIVTAVNQTPEDGCAGAVSRPTIGFTITSPDGATAEITPGGGLHHNAWAMLESACKNSRTTNAIINGLRVDIADDAVTLTTQYIKQKYPAGPWTSAFGDAARIAAEWYVAYQRGVAAKYVKDNPLPTGEIVVHRTALPACQLMWEGLGDLSYFRGCMHMAAALGHRNSTEQQLREWGKCNDDVAQTINRYYTE